MPQTYSARGFLLQAEKGRWTPLRLILNIICLNLFNYHYHRKVRSQLKVSYRDVAKKFLFICCWFLVCCLFHFGTTLSGPTEYAGLTLGYVILDHSWQNSGARAGILNGLMQSKHLSCHTIALA